MSQIPDWYESVGEGWRKILAGLDGKLKLIDPNYQVAQVKEKFGGLRVYLNHIDQGEVMVEACNDLVQVAEQTSFRTCEQCGRHAANGARPRKGTRFGWVKTYCDYCYEAWVDVPEAG